MSYEGKIGMASAALLVGVATLAFTPIVGNAQSTVNTSPEAVESGHYVVEPKHTQVEFTVLHMGFSYYTGGFVGSSGELDLDPKSVAASTVRISVPVASVVTNSQKLDGELKSADWLDAAKFPDMSFRSTTVTPGDKGTAKIMGDLTIHGITKSVTFDARFVGSGVNPLSKKYTVGFALSGDIKRSDFGVTKYLPLIGDELHLSINAAFEKQSSAP